MTHVCLLLCLVSVIAMAVWTVTAAVLMAPVALGAMVFTAGGTATGSTAAGIMSSAAVANGGGVAAGSLVAALYVATAIVGSVEAAAGGAVRWVTSKFRGSLN
uniref:Uncharacterized protein n=1 Tax=Hucho hucho TaxID=62062 RepID=A0A4W5PZG8_9TELE